MTLTTQQNTALKLIREFIDSEKQQIFILKGYAGTGKTTLIASIMEYIQEKRLEARLMAPTGRAAKILRNKVSSIQATTIHKGIYAFEKMIVNEEESILKYFYPLREENQPSICVIDEASMISSQKAINELFVFGSGMLLDDLLSYAQARHGGKLIFVGDPMQLPPVNDNRSAALDETFFQDLGFSVSSFELTDVVRQQKDSCILTNAFKIRDLTKSEKRNQLIFNKKEGEVMDLDMMRVPEWYCQHDCKDSAIVCFSNHQAADYNREIRAIKFPEAKHVCVGDRLMIVNNNYADRVELLNGDLIEVTGVSDEVTRLSAPVWVTNGDERKQVSIALNFREIQFETEDGIVMQKQIIDSLLENQAPGLNVEQLKSLYISLVMRLREKGLTNIKSKEFATAANDDPFYNALHVKYGYAFTCHKSQGGEWKNVFVDFFRRTGLDMNCLRWKYTAVTRAREKLWCVNLPNITPMSGMNISAITRAGKKSGDKALAYAPVNETPFHDATHAMALKAKYWSVLKNMDGSNYTIKNVEHKPYREIYEIETAHGPNRVDALYNGAGLFSRYELEHPDAELLTFFENEENILFDIHYQSSIETLNGLYQKMVSLCDECEIVLTNVVEANYRVTYYMRASGNFASVAFDFNAKGFIRYAAVLSDLGEADEKLCQLVDKLKKD